MPPLHFDHFKEIFISYIFSFHLSHWSNWTLFRLARYGHDEIQFAVILRNFSAHNFLREISRKQCEVDFIFFLGQGSFPIQGLWIVITILQEFCMLVLWIDLPQFERSVHTRGRQQFGVVVPCEGIDDVRVTFKLLDGLLRSQVPNPDHSILSCGSQKLSIRRKCQRMNWCLVPTNS